jgi:sucrose-6F-phosphate phosphohydrolase
MSDPRLFLCTDLDRTLLPNGPQPEAASARDRFARLAQRRGVTLAYVTGRHRALVEQAIANYGLPQPDFAITDVGTKIHAYEQGAWQPWLDWEREIATDWAHHDRAALARLFFDLKPLRLQEVAKQNTHKLSYYLPVQANQEELQHVMQQRLRKNGIRASLVWSIDEPAGVGLLDVLPERATKLQAVQFLRQQLGFELTQTVFAGDSGNDLEIMASEVPSVLVANATNEVREAAIQQARANGHAASLYLARGGYLDMDGNYSAGILEGVAHFQPDFARWLLEQE